MYCKVCVGKYLCDNFPIQNDLKQWMLYRCCFTTLVYNVPFESLGNQVGLKFIGHISF
jgi:hypothetical protein